MNELTTAMSRIDNSSAATLFELSESVERQSPEALQESLQHLLTIPIQSALNQLPRERVERLREQGVESEAFSQSQKQGICSFGELLRYSQPPLEMLRFAKDFGKAIVHSKGAVWPSQVGEVLNYAAYAVALVCCRERLGTLSEAQLKKGFQKAAARTWVPAEIAQLFGRALDRLQRRAS